MRYFIEMDHMFHSLKITQDLEKIEMLIREISYYQKTTIPTDTNDTIGYPCGLRRRRVFIHEDHD